MKAALIAATAAFLAGGGFSSLAGELRIEPDLAVLPANHLKFYLQFPGPMERGEVFRHLRLVEIDGEGQPLAEVPEPFREVELWDETFTRLTLWFHPGRQKPGVNLNVEIGPILEEGKRYRLELSGKWRGESGAPLGEGAGHEFVAGPPDEESPTPARWRFVFEGGLVRVEAGEALDPVSLRRRVVVLREEREEAVPVEIAATETGFLLSQSGGWMPGRYRLVVDPRLEDLAGNSVARPFNLDLSKAGADPADPSPAVVPFEVPVSAASLPPRP